MNKTPDCPKYLGMILRHARKQYNIQLENMATILRTTNELLKKYESRQLHIPQPILERIFIVGIGYMRLNKVNRHFHYMTRVHYKYGNYKYIAPKNNKSDK